MTGGFSACRWHSFNAFLQSFASFLFFSMRARTSGVNAEDFGLSLTEKLDGLKGASSSSKGFKTPTIPCCGGGLGLERAVMERASWKKEWVAVFQKRMELLWRKM